VTGGPWETCHQHLIDAADFNVPLQYFPHKGNVATVCIVNDRKSSNSGIGWSHKGWTVDPNSQTSYYKSRDENKSCQINEMYSDHEATLYTQYAHLSPSTSDSKYQASMTSNTPHQPTPTASPEISLTPFKRNFQGQKGNEPQHLTGFASGPPPCY
jgi:hypothetical protein